ncbi:MAG TPA: beta-ketoacyl-[acyl-carrier-protein] synthase family protein, partial [Candidatus Sulfotelmatobacter sp.]|nr:beta-ketoacyl-[acyl-carrier-protein] synthase family protein [Candidatus Sulfotelmatobacter sp.]
MRSGGAGDGVEGDQVRVAVTGMGIVTPIGIGVDAYWKAALAGTSGVGPIRHFDASGLPARIASYVHDATTLERWRSVLGLRAEEPRSLLFALAAGRMAYQAAGWSSELGGPRLGVVFGTYGDKLDMPRIAGIAFRARPGDSRETTLPHFVPAYCQELQGEQLARLMPHCATSGLARMFEAAGQTCTIQTACTSSAQAIGQAFREIRHGHLDRAICGGAECVVTQNQIIMFSLLGVLSTRNDEPERASRPFDGKRDGFVLGEGSAVLVLERMDLARRRGAPILCELAGYGTSCDAYRLTDEDPEGRGGVLAMQRALASAKLAPEEVDYINAHGTSTAMNDRVETAAIKGVLGARAPQVPVSSTKSMVGHTVSAAGAIEAVTSILALRDQMLPPTINYEQPDPQCDLDYVPNVARPAR